MDLNARPALWLSCNIVLLVFLTTGWCAVQDNFALATQLELAGKFREAAEALDGSLTNKTLSPSDRARLEFEKDRLERIKKDYPLTKPALITALKSAVTNASPEEIESWFREGRFDSRNIDGERRFMSESVPNLFWRFPELNPRRVPARNTSVYQSNLLAVCRQIKQEAQARQRPYVLPKRFRVTMKIATRTNAALTDGELVRAWLPIPRDYPFQHGFQLLASSSPVKQLEPADSPIRSAYFETTAKASEATAFQVQYEYETLGVRFEVDPKRVRAGDPRHPEQNFAKEAPHIVFTPEIRALAQHLAGSEPNHYLKARRFYDWISEHIQYSYAIEYSTIRNISEYCRIKRYGDCGQEALLFMTLCRASGIPARWQSGWNIFPGAKSIHDWCEIYLEPYGWLPVDPYAGIYAAQYATSLSASEKRELRDFYFGGLDQYRLIANSDHNQELNPPKRTFRSDTVDFQRGELEANGHNLYFDQFTYELTAQEITPKSSRVD